MFCSRCTHSSKLHPQQKSHHEIAKLEMRLDYHRYVTDDLTDLVHRLENKRTVTPPLGNDHRASVAERPMTLPPVRQQGALGLDTRLPEFDRKRLAWAFSNAMRMHELVLITKKGCLS